MGTCTWLHVESSARVPRILMTSATGARSRMDSVSTRNSRRSKSHLASPSLSPLSPRTVTLLVLLAALLSISTSQAAAFTTAGVSHQPKQQQVLLQWGSVSSINHNNKRIPDVHKRNRASHSMVVQMVSNSDDDNSNDSNKFGFAQRIDSGKSLVVGAIVGSFALLIPEILHELVMNPVLSSTSLLPTQPNGLAQFEFDEDMAALLCGLFAICYRYAIRMDKNPQLAQGVVGAFCLTRTLSRIVVPAYCTAPVLQCGAPLGYLDWNILTQLALNGAESLCMFGATALAMEYCMEKGWISKFPG